MHHPATGWMRAAAVAAALSLAVPHPAHAQTVDREHAKSPADMAKEDGGHPPYMPADVHFMQGMIGHHSQAVTMAGWAASHGASPSLLTLAQRIDVSQRDEIVFMSHWLRSRHEMVPDPAMHHDMPGMDMSGALMPGMLTPEQMTQLDKARGPEFDRLFITFMIQHHRGALSMVDALFGAEGAGQDDDIFKFASDVASDQTAEIDRMTDMLPAATAAAGRT